MVIEKITLQNFKNYENAEFRFSPSMNLITGLNGSGKTNLLDAIYYICLTKSAFNNLDSNNVRMGSDFFSIHSKILKNEVTHSILCSYTKGQKNIKLDRVLYKKSSEHIGRFPCVLIAPNDTDLVREGSEGRRRFFDSLISQLDQDFLQDLIQYSHLLKQRNSALKIFQTSNQIDQNLIDYYNIHMLSYGKSIHETRKKFIEEFEPLFIKYYQFLSEEKEAVSLKYQSHCESISFENDFYRSLQKDILLQRTTMGIHKDDFLFAIKNTPLKNFGSQGQQKSFVIALKIAQYEIIKNKKGFMPILLLDDIFDKLDDHRINKLLSLISSSLFGQLFITDARIDRLEKYIRSISREMSIFNISNGQLIHE